MKLRDLFEAPSRTAVVAFGRMNPPTIGHAKLVDKIKSMDGDHYVFLSQSQKPKTDPLEFADKLRYAKFFFPEITIGNPKVRTPIQMMQHLQELGYTDIIYIAGSDRVPAFDKLFNDYNGKDYTFNSIQVVSAGERDPDADGAEGMSASKMRAAAAEGNLDAFKQGVPRAEVADEMFNAVRQGMGIRDTETAEDASEDEEDEFHRKLDKLVHKTFGHSSDEKKKGKVYETEQTLPDKMQSFLEPFPQIPQAQAEPYTTQDGQQISPMKGGGVKLSNDAGTFIWDPQGKPLTYTTPKINGLHQVHDMKTGNFIVYYQDGTIKVEQEYDKNGNKIGDAGASFNAGPANISRDRSGRTSASYTIGDQTISTDDKNFTGFNTNSIRKRQGRQDIGQ